VDRAIANDVESIGLCRVVLEELNGKMLEFDFRNGPLRRKYDGLKYALRNVEDILFELSLTDKDTNSSGSEPPEKRARVETGAAAVLDVAEFDAIRKRLDEVDAKREDLIKKSRDVQKLSKQAIFSIQRGNLTDADEKLRSAKGIASNLFDAIVSKVLLRMSSYYT
jgi:predicted translin family RNA/ssDNA-binding protein